jgi:hypothetical protein
MTILSNETQENQLLQAALSYARRGWRVVPLHSVTDGRCSCGKDCGQRAGKHPRTRHGLTDATTDEATIRSWWGAWPSANVGIQTGTVSRLFMLGPDGEDGIEALTELERQHGPLPPTLRVRSGGGGLHYYFAWPAAGNVKTRANCSGLPIDVRGGGGLAVAPPSTHCSGGAYAWDVPPGAVEVAEAPPWLLAWLRNGEGTNGHNKGNEGKKETNQPPESATINSFVRTPPPGDGKFVFTVRGAGGLDPYTRAAAYLDKCPPAVSGQGGHDQTFQVARAVVYGFGLGAEAGFALLWERYNPQCVPPWSEAELRHKCADADTKPFDKPRGYLLLELEPPGTDASSPLASGQAGEDIEALAMPPPAPWPELAPAALHGLAGEIVQTMAPETESDPVAILGQLLVAFGNAAGGGPHYMVEGDSHHTNLFLCLVGESSRGRKGTSRGRVMQVMGCADDPWCQKCVAGGLSSGEGLISAVRDPTEKSEPIKEKGRVVGYQTVVVDEGVSDKRLLADESEFAQVLKVLQREGNSLSPVIRQSWDTGNLRTLTRNNPVRATGAHISIAGHITRPELAKHLKDTEALNGFANRFLWLCVRRSRLLPDGGRALDLSALGARLNYALAAARGAGPMTRSLAAGRLWRAVYAELTAERPGLYGAVTGRAEAQALRLSMVYALLDGSCVIEEGHLRAALALWAYADASARLIFGAEPEDPLIGLVLTKLREAGTTGMTRTGLHNAFNRNIKAAKLLEALAKLRDRGAAYPETVRTGQPGAPAERWFARRRNEGIPAPAAPVPGQAADGNDPFNSFVRPLSSRSTAGGEEVVTL